jgi:FkbM family methyltransferase
MRLFNYLKLPLSAVRHWFEAMDAIAYSKKERWHMFKVLLYLRFKEIGGRSNEVISANIFGFKIHAYDYTTLLFLFREIFLTRDYLFKSDTSQPRIIDCGANIGMSIFFLKYFYPQAEIIAFEPNPDAYSLLKKNVEANQLKQVTLHNKAVSANTNGISFFVNEDKGTLLASIKADRGGSRELQIETVLLSDFLTTKANLVKIDIEGAEWLVLEDLQNHAASFANIEQLIMEYHHKMEGESSKFSNWLNVFEGLGFEYNMKTNYRNQGDFQDIVIHFYRN